MLPQNNKYLNFRFAQQGGHVMICDKDVDRSKLGFVHPNVVDFIACDVSNRSDFENVFIETRRIVGNVDVLVNNAGIIRENKYERKKHLPGHCHLGIQRH